MTPQEAKAAIRAGRHVNAAVVLSGGGAPGVDYAIGFLKGLRAAGFDFSELAGTSAGAVASGLLASSNGGGIAEAEARLRSIPVDAVSPSLWGEFIMHTWGTSICGESDPALKLLRKHISPTWAGLHYPCHWFTAAMASPSYIRTECTPDIFDTPAESIRASMGVEFVLPCVRGFDGRLYSDCGILFNVPLLDDWPARFDIVFVCINQAKERNRPLTSVPNTIQQAKNVVSSMLVAQIEEAIDDCLCLPNVVLLQPPFVNGEQPMLKFDHSLIDVAAAQVAQWMQEN